MADIKKQFSLDYLIPGETRGGKGADAGVRALDEAVILYSQPILEILAKADGKEMRAHDLAREAARLKPVPGLEYESFIEVCKHLERLRFIDIAERDVTGNHLIRLLRTD